MVHTNKITRAKALELLSMPKTAPATEWRPSRVLKGTYEISVGVVKRDTGENFGLEAHLAVKVRSKPQQTHWKFSLFQSDAFGKRRVYQLDTARPPLGRKIDHSWPHQHIGDERVPFDSDFPASFEAAMKLFLHTANLSFDDTIESPEIFRLRMS